MTTELVLAAVGAGKTEYALQQLVDTVQAVPFGQSWVLLPGSRQEDAFRQRLVDYGGGQSVYFNINFFNFYSLYQRLLDMVSEPQRELDATARLSLIRRLLINLRDTGDLEVFGEIADKPGFAQIIADFIYELKQNVVEPDAFARAARSAKDRDLSTIYNIYQDTFRDFGLVDREGEGWLALDRVAKDDEIGRHVKLLLVDGFDQFNPLQMELIALLATRASKTIITLPIIKGREATVGRRFTEASAKLETILKRRVPELVIKELSLSPSPHRHSGLQELANRYSLSATSPLPNGEPCLALIEVPEPKQEAEAVMRRVKRLLLNGCVPDDILIAVRDWGRYGGHLASAIQQYGIPAVLHYGEPLANNPAIIALFNLLQLSDNQFRRRDVLDVLRSPYFETDGLGSDEIDLLDRISQTQQVISGRENWLDGIRLAAQKTKDENGEEQDALISLTEAQRLEQSLALFFVAVTPPTEASELQYVQWIEDLIGADTEIDPNDDETIQSPEQYSLHIFSGMRATVEGRDIVARDLIAWQAFSLVLRGMLATQRLFTALNLATEPTITWQTLFRDLKSSVGRAATSHSPNRAGRVLITSVTDARGLPHKHVMLPGLSEGIFPLPVPEDPLYLDSERAALTRAGILLETQAERAADDGLFYELLCQARETLTLTRPTVQNGAPWPESHLWRAIKQVYADSDQIIANNRLRPGSTIHAEETSNHSEAMLAVAEALSLGTAENIPAAVYNRLVQSDAAGWARVVHARSVERQRMTGRTFDMYSGWLHEPHLLEWVAGELGEKRVWSASQFNDYGMCGFRFFAKRLLKLEELEEPKEGMDVRQLGTVNHELLEKTYQRLAELGLTITPQHQEQAVAVLNAVTDELLPTAPQRHGFKQPPLWAQEQQTLRRKLEAIVRLDFSEDAPFKKFVDDIPRQPYQQEAAFDRGEREVLTLPLDGDNHLRVTGYIDRMDRIGDRVVVVDYKTGSTRIPVKEMEQGKNFQMMLYLLAGQALLDKNPDSDAPKQVVGGVFWHLRDGKTSGEIHLDSDEGQAAIAQARAHLSAHLQHGRAGQFPAQPALPGSTVCSHYCEFSHLCRASIMKRRKAQ
ncbi:MAG: PD-(D/E)XK nuclease family protein [Anaerolineae bacterium]